METGEAGWFCGLRGWKLVCLVGEGWMVQSGREWRVCVSACERKIGAYRKENKWL